MALAMEGPCGPASGQGPEACEQHQEGRGCGEPEDPLGRGGLGGSTWRDGRQAPPVQKDFLGRFAWVVLVVIGVKKLYVATGVEEMGCCRAQAEP